MNEIWGHLVFVMSVCQSVTLRLTNIIHTLAIPLTRRRHRLYIWHLYLKTVNLVNHTSWVAVVTPTDRPKSVRNCCLIELFCSVVCVVICPFDISVGVGTFVIGLGQISSFLS